MACMLLLGIAASTVSQAATQNHSQIRDVASLFVEQQGAAMPGKVSYKVTEIDPRIALPACDKLEAFLPAGSPLIGKTSIGVRCLEKNGWSIFVPVQIKVSLNLLASARQLPMGHVLQEQDLTSQTTEVSQTEGLVDPQQAIGKVLRYSIASGQILREDMLRPPFSVTQGQIVPLIVQSDGFSIRSEGAALGNAAAGQTVQVRIGSGHVIGGVARANGVVEVGP
jgi:flagella basal body P-ring formation protein FlgA